MTYFNYKFASQVAVLITFALLVSAGVAEAATNIGTAINKAGQQRMLTQRIVKDYFLIASDINTENAKQQIDASVGTFEQNLRILQESSPNKEISKALDEVDSLWLDFRLTALSEVDKKVAKKFMADGEELLEKCQKVVEKLTAYSGVQGAAIVDISGRQRMLSQRIAKYYAAYFYGLKYGDIVEQLNKAVKEYETAMKKLDDYSGNTSETREKLRKVNAQWMFAKKGLEGFPKDDELKPFIIAVSMDSILTKMNDLTNDYALMADKVASAQ